MISKHSLWRQKYKCCQAPQASLSLSPPPPPTLNGWKLFIHAVLIAHLVRFVVLDGNNPIRWMYQIGKNNSSRENIVTFSCVYINTCTSVLLICSFQSANISLIFLSSSLANSEAFDGSVVKYAAWQRLEISILKHQCTINQVQIWSFHHWFLKCFGV